MRNAREKGKPTNKGELVAPADDDKSLDPRANNENVYITTH